MSKTNFGVKKLDSLISLNLAVILFAGLGLAYSILAYKPQLKPNIIDNNPLVLGTQTDESCFDDDALSLNKSIYIPGQVSFYKEVGNVSYYKDHCIEGNTKLVEEFCEFDKTTNHTGIRSIVYICEYGCKEGACLTNPETST